MLHPLIQTSYLFYDPPKIKGDWYEQIKELQIDPRKPLFADRLNEIKAYFHTNNLFHLKYHILHGPPSSDRFKRHYFHAFEGGVGPERLKAAYDSIPLDYTIRLMLAYERFSMITDYLDFLVHDSNRELDTFHILDYGCGVSDIGLLFSSMGAQVTICDLDNSRLDFVIDRFHQRGYAPTVIRVSDTETYPDLPSDEFDLIVATELFEHVRDPLKLLQNFSSALRKGGYLFDSMGGVFEKDHRPHHLREAESIGNSEEYKLYYSHSFEHITLKDNLRYLFKKK